MTTDRNGVPLVLVPGLLCDPLLWAPQITGLAGAAQCWVADHTRSDTVAAIAADVLADAPFERFALAGLSMGGYIAMEMLRQAPERITRAALLDTAARADGPEQITRRNELIAMSERGRFTGASEALLPTFIHPDRLADASLVAIIATMARNTGSDVFVRQQRAIMSRIDSRPSLAAVRCPALVLCGRQDALTPLERSQEIAAAIPGARLEVIEHCGHLTTLERPVETTAALAGWLTP